MLSTLSVRDRTLEFFNAVEAVQSSRQPVVARHEPATPATALVDNYRNDKIEADIPLLDDDPGGSSMRRRPAAAGSRPLPPAHGSRSRLSQSVANQSQFSKAAAVIGRGIHDVTQKMEELGKMARQRSLFNDRMEEIQELTSVVKQDITTLNAEIDKLASFAASTPHGSSAQSASHEHNIVDTLKGQLANATKEFAEILQIRTKNLKEQNARGKNYVSSKSRSLRNRPLNSFGAFGEDGDEKSGSTPGRAAQRSGLHEQLLATEEEDAYLQNRAQAIQSIEKTINELGEIYKRLSIIVQMQHEVALKIDEDMDVTLENVEQGHQELLKYFNNISSNRWLIIKVFAVLICFAVFFVIFVA